MNKILLLTCITLLFAACNAKRTDEPVKLQGKYAAVGFKVKDSMEKNGGKLVSKIQRNDFAFNFLNDEALQITPDLGAYLFSDSIFKYKITDKTLFLTAEHRSYAIPYNRNGNILNLYVNKNGIDTLQISPLKTE